MVTRLLDNMEFYANPILRNSFEKKLACDTNFKKQDWRVVSFACDIAEAGHGIIRHL